MPGSATEWGDPADLAYLSEVRELCRLAPHKVVGFVERRTPLDDVLAEMIDHVFGRTLPAHAARRQAPWRDLFDGAD